MKLGFRERPDDLLVGLSLLLVLSALAVAGVGGILGLLAGVLVVLFLPGYALIAALFPATGEITWLQRITLSIVVSLAVVPLAALLANLVPGGVRLGPVLLILDVLAAGGFAVAYRSRMRIAPRRRLHLSIELTLPTWRRTTRTERLLVLGLALLVAIGSASVAYSYTQYRPAPGFTEFYVLNETGGTGGLAHLNLTVGEPGNVILVAVNHEREGVNYSIDVRLTTLATVVNGSSGKNETVEIANETFSTWSFTLADGNTQRFPLGFAINQTGDYRLKFLLYRETPPLLPHRLTYLHIRVS